MADPIITAARKQNAEKRLRAAAQAVSGRFGVELKRPTVAYKRFPGVYDVEQLENIVAMLERLAAVPQPRKERVSA